MTETETPLQEVDTKELKIQALRERISVLVTNYEDQDSERRVQLTLLSMENEQLKQQLKEATSVEKDSNRKTDV